ncbi:MAG: cupin domain-containing protein [Nitrospinaceae bacterium]|nr:cupin domain-containing protein [Nitrospinaceae bacterium]
MAKVLSVKNLPVDEKYEPGFELTFGITDETTGIETATLVKTHFPPASRSKRHYHTDGDLIWYCISGTAVWYIGEELEKFVTEPGDFMFIPRGEVQCTEVESATEPVEGVGGYGGCSNPYKSGKVFIE